MCKYPRLVSPNTKKKAANQLCSVSLVMFPGVFSSKSFLSSNMKGKGKIYLGIQDEGIILKREEHQNPRTTFSVILDSLALESLLRGFTRTSPHNP